MDFSNAKYKKLDDEITCIMATCNGQKLAIPINNENTHYQAILAWAAIDGNSIAAAD